MNVAVNNEESRLLFIDHRYGEMSLERQLHVYDPDAVLVVMAVDNRESLFTAEMMLSYLTKMEVINNKPVILVANKSDLVRSREIKHYGRHSLLKSCLVGIKDLITLCESSTIHDFVSI